MKIQIAATLLAIVLLVWVIPWRDRVRTVPSNVPEGGSPPRLMWAADEPSGGIEVVEPGVITLATRLRVPGLATYVACLLAILALLVVRWRILLGLAGTRPSLAWCAVHMARSQVISALPFSQVGGDLYRMERGTRVLSGVAPALLVVAAERIAGLWALVLTAWLGFIASGMRFSHSAGGLICTAALLLAPLGCGAIRFLNLPRTLRRRAEVMLWLGRLTADLRSVAGWFDRPWVIAEVLVASICVHLLTACSFIAIDRALGLTTPAWCYLVAIPAVTLAQYLPIHIAGIGILEGGLWVCLGHWANRTPVEVVALCAACRVLGLAWLALLTLAFAVNGSTDPGRGGHCIALDPEGRCYSGPDVSTSANGPRSSEGIHGRLLST